VKKPWLRKEDWCWYIKSEDGKQIKLGKDPRYEGKNPPALKPKSPPPEILERMRTVQAKGAAPKDLTLSVLFEKFLASVQEKPTHRPTKHVLKRLLAGFGDLKVSKLRPHHLTDYLKDKPLKPSSKRSYADRLIACLNWGVASGWLDANPLKVPGFKRPGRHERRKEVLDTETMDRLEAAAPPALQAFLIVLRESGARPVELTRARVERYKDGVMHFPNKTAEKTGEAERPIFLNERARAVVERAIGTRTEGPILRTPWGEAWSVHNLQQHFYRLRKRIGLGRGILLYGYRHSMASRAINETNVNPALVAKLLGHTDLVYLMRNYFHEDPDAMRKAIEEATRKS
jgi:integrase